jgi:Bacterial pre-peptidase C-terminal domain/Quinohemoprotein amine dehydrogenase, alpha subunit domain III
MKRACGVVGALFVGAVVVGCTGAQGPAGKEGPPGTGSPSVSAVTPSSAFLSRTVDLTIAGSGTSWDSSTTVAFAEAGVTVNKVTVASPTGLVVNITIGGTATVGPTDVTVSDGSSKEVYAGAFQIEAPLVVTVDPPAGVPQGGLANLHVVMLDLTTPFDPNTTTVTLGSSDLLMSEPEPTDYAFDLTVEADVLAATGTFDMDVQSDSVDSPAAQSFKIAARQPMTLASTTTATGMISTELDTSLFQYTPASAAQRFVQFTVGSMAGQVSGSVIPKSGKYADAIASNFAIRQGQGTTSTDALYVVVGDSDGLFGAGPTPADFELVPFDALCTAVAQETQTASTNIQTAATAQAVTTLPALVNGTLGFGNVDPTMATDFYSFTVPAGATKIHVATGGDPLDDTVLQIFDGTMTSVATSDDLDYQEDLVFPVQSTGTYYVSVSASNSGAFSAADNTYQLFIATE